MKLSGSSPKGKKTLWEKEQFLLFLQCVQKTCTADTYKYWLVWERVKCSLKDAVFFDNVDNNYGQEENVD